MTEAEKVKMLKKALNTRLDAAHVSSAASITKTERKVAHAKIQAIADLRFMVEQLWSEEE